MLSVVSLARLHIWWKWSLAASPCVEWKSLKSGLTGFFKIPKLAPIRLMACAPREYSNYHDCNIPSMRSKTDWGFWVVCLHCQNIQRLAMHFLMKSGNKLPDFFSIIKKFQWILKFKRNLGDLRPNFVTINSEGPVGKYVLKTSPAKA